MNLPMRALLLLTGLALLAVPALAASPVGGSDYLGRTQQGDRYPVRVEVARDGDSIDRMRFSWGARRCQLAKKGAQGRTVAKGMNVRNGRFAAHGTDNQRIPRDGPDFLQRVQWKLRGTFPTADRAAGWISVTATITNSAGQFVDVCKTTDRLKWTARRLGLDEP